MTIVGVDVVYFWRISECPTTVYIIIVSDRNIILGDVMKRSRFLSYNPSSKDVVFDFILGNVCHSLLLGTS